LLGFAFEPSESGNLLVSISITSKERHPFNDSIAGTLDNAYWGLPLEYGKAVLRTIQNCEVGIGAGVLDFCCAAHSDVGSEQVIFACLTRTLLLALRERLGGNAVAEAALNQSYPENAAILSSNRSPTSTW
jgi:hypothetical protein